MVDNPKLYTLLVNCKITTPSPAKYHRANNVNIIELEDGAILITNGDILSVGSWKDIKEDLSYRGIREEEIDLVIDCQGRALLPGFVDSHTHLIYAGSRVHEFLKRIRGVSYLQIAEEGGGIKYTVQQTRRASKDELHSLAKKRIEKALLSGTVAFEVKSGYHLNLEGEELALDIIKELQDELNVDLVPTLLAHIVPADENREDYVRKFINLFLPKLREKAKFVDVFCDVGAFTVDETEAILRRAKELGYLLKVHANEFESTGIVEIAVKLGARSLDHLLKLTDEEVKLIASSETCATLMPGTSFFIDEPYAPAKELAKNGAIIALATDYNAGSSQTLSMPFIASLSALKLKLDPEVILAGLTVNGAYASGLEGRYGVIAEGYVGSAVILDTRDWRELAFSPGTDLIWNVLVRGTPLREMKSIAVV